MKGNEIIKKLHNALAFFFMLTYLAALVGNPVHVLSHSWQGEEVCSEPDNACHLKIVHADFEHGCSHETHLVEDKGHQCDLCATITITKIALLAGEQALRKPQISEQNFTAKTAAISGKTVNTEKPRGPPFYS